MHAADLMSNRARLTPDRVSVLAHNGVPYVDLFYGLAKIGVILAPLNWRLVARELEYIVTTASQRC